MDGQLLKRIADKYNFEIDQNSTEKMDLKHGVLLKPKPKDENYVYIFDFSESTGKIDSFEVDDYLDDVDFSRYVVICVFANEDQMKNFESKYYDSFLLYVNNSNRNNSISIKFEGPEENYLEYKIKKGDKEIEYYIFNISLTNLLLLSKGSYTKLYSKNVREYLGYKIGKENLLYSNFKKYLIEFLKKNEFELDDSDQKNDDDEDNDFVPELFWASHNGITICTDEFNIKGRQLTFNNPNFIYVLNGCQTISNFERIICDFENKYKPEKLGDLLKEFGNKIIIKTTILKENNIKNIHRFNLSLNTQLPIEEKDILPSLEQIQDLNMKFKDVTVLRPGSVAPKGMIGIDGLTLMKFNCLLDDKPGKAKNYSTKNLLEEAKKLYNKNKDKVDELENAIIVYYEANRIFKKHQRGKNDSSELFENGGEQFEGIRKFGVYYFEWYCYQKYLEFEKTQSENRLDYIYNFIESNQLFDNFCKAMLEFAKASNKVTFDIGYFKTDHSDFINAFKAI